MNWKMLIAPARHSLQERLQFCSNFRLTTFYVAYVSLGDPGKPRNVLLGQAYSFPPRPKT
jgi:hypothetical protein